MAGTHLSKRRESSKRAPLLMIFAGTGLFLSGIFGIWFMWQQTSDLAQTQEISAVPRMVEYPAPALFLHDINGNPVSLESLVGQVVLINNWATWCPPCRAEMPTLEAYYQTYKEKGFILVAIDSGEPADIVLDFVENYSLTFPIWLDPGAKALRTFRNNSLPSSYIIDREGIIRLAWTGAISRDMLEKHVTPLLEN